MLCEACKTESLGCGCDGAVTSGCWLCEPDAHDPPPCTCGGRLERLKPGDRLPPELATLRIDPEQWNKRKVPKPLQEYLREENAWVGEYTDRGFFLVEVYDQGQCFRGWWETIQEEFLAEWAAKQSDEKLAHVFLVNGFLTALSRANPSPKTSIFERIHKAVVEEGKRRGIKLRGKMH